MDHDMIHTEADVDDLISDIHQLIDEEPPSAELPAEEPAAPEPEPEAEEVPAPESEPEPEPVAEAPFQQQRWTERQKVPKHVARLQQNQEEAYAQWLKEQEEKGEQLPPVFEEELPPKKKKREKQPEPVQEEEQAAVAVKPKKNRFALWFCLTLAVLTLILAVLTVVVVPRQPQAQAEHIHAAGASTVLLAGTDDSHGRTDMLMLLSVNSAKGELSYVSIPRDTPVLTREHGLVKLGTVYGRAGGGKAGIAALEQAVRDCVGFVPDGTMVLHPEALMVFAERLGGVDFEEKTLTGEEVLELVSKLGEEEAPDLTRVQTQRRVLAALIEQCCSLRTMVKTPRLLDALQKNTVTNLTTENLLWLAKAAFAAESSSEDMVTLPGTMLENGTYCLDEELVVQTVNAYCNPYIRAIGQGDLAIFSEEE